MVATFAILQHSKRVFAFHPRQPWRRRIPCTLGSASAASFSTITSSSSSRRRNYPRVPEEHRHFSTIPLAAETEEDFDNVLPKEDSIPPTTNHNKLRKKRISSNKFQVTAPYSPTGDQPQAIQRLVEQVERGDKYSILRGITGTGKTLVMAHTIARLGKPALVLCHNKTLAAQLARELRSCLSKNHVQLFVSYYNHYVPESYNESSNRYTAKKSSINDELDALRHLATRSLVQHSDVVVVASVSCIYGLGMPKSYLDAALQWTVGETAMETPQDIVEAMESTLYSTNTGEEALSNSSDLSRGQYQLSQSGTGATLVLWPPSESFPMRVDFHRVEEKERTTYRISSIAQGHASGMTPIDTTTIFPAKHHISHSEERFEEALSRIQDELKGRVDELRKESKQLEADRLSQRVSQDLLMMRETGTCSGVENYSRHMALREEGQAPDTLLDYFGYGNQEDWLLLVDESHVTLPQLKAMYGGDRARKQRLVKHGFRLPSALDNRPLKVDEFWERVPQSIFVSATPSKQELNLVALIDKNEPVEMMIRPTFVCDPVIHVRPQQNQLDDLVEEIKARAQRKERTLAMSVTKRDAEDLADYLIEKGIAAAYIHSGLNTHERANALKALQSGEIDCLVGVNLLREGLDLPQVSLVAVLNADSEGFLRSETALLQTIGRAARNVRGTAILYANRVTNSMQQCIDATQYRRKVQLEYNAKHGKEMKSTEGSSVLSIFDLLKDKIEAEQPIEVVKSIESNDKLLPKIDLSAPVTTSVNITDDTGIVTDHIPSKPGVYFWKDSAGEVLYIGKAKRLRSRVKSYLSPGAKHSMRIHAMLKKVQRVEFILTPSDRDALLLESNLIKHHQPPYNVLLKDDESYPYICASIGDAFPQFTIVPRRQEGEMASKYKYFGPYPHYSEINMILQAIEEAYDLRSKSFQARFGEVAKADFQSLFKKVMSEVFEFSGKSGESSLPALRSEYEEASKLFESEYNQCRDVIAVGRSEDDSTFIIHVLQLRHGLIAGQFSYACELESGLETEEDFGDAIQTVLEQRHYPSGEAPTNGRYSFFPDELLLQYPLAESKELKGVIRSARNAAEPDRKGSKISIRNAVSRGPRKDVDKRALQCAIENAEQIANEISLAHIKGAPKTSVDGTAMKELASLLSLEKEPERIECYDVSHTQGEVAVASRVVFINGRPAPHLYRRFNIKTVDGIDDYASLEEVLERRFHRVWVNGESGLVDGTDPWSMPDLVVIDGGKGQLSAALKGMAKANVYPEEEPFQKPLAEDYEQGIIDEEEYPAVKRNGPERHTSVPVIALAKNREEVYVHDGSDPVNDSPDSPALLLLRALRDESHRFALSAHRKRRSKLIGLSPQIAPKRDLGIDMKNF
jgi:excinuclease ABC subunit B